LVSPLKDPKLLSFSLSLAETYQTTLSVSAYCAPVVPNGFQPPAAVDNSNCAYRNPAGVCA